MLTREDRHQVEAQIKDLEFRLMLTVDPGARAELQGKIINLEDRLFQQILDEMLELGTTLPNTETQ